jgi:hypothetical protein
VKKRMRYKIEITIEIDKDNIERLIQEERERYGQSGSPAYGFDGKVRTPEEYIFCDLAAIKERYLEAIAGDPYLEVIQSDMTEGVETDGYDSQEQAGTILEQWKN